MATDDDFDPEIHVGIFIDHVSAVQACQQNPVWHGSLRKFIAMEGSLTIKEARERFTRKALLHGVPMRDVTGEDCTLFSARAIELAMMATDIAGVIKEAITSIGKDDEGELYAVLAEDLRTAKPRQLPGRTVFSCRTKAQELVTRFNRRFQVTEHGQEVYGAQVIETDGEVAKKYDLLIDRECTCRAHRSPRSGVTAARRHDVSELTELGLPEPGRGWGR